MITVLAPALIYRPSLRTSRGSHPLFAIVYWNISMFRSLICVSWHITSSMRMLRHGWVCIAPCRSCVGLTFLIQLTVWFDPYFQNVGILDYNKRQRHHPFPRLKTEISTARFNSKILIKKVYRIESPHTTISRFTFYIHWEIVSNNPYWPLVWAPHWLLTCGGDTTPSIPISNAGNETIRLWNSRAPNVAASVEEAHGNTTITTPDCSDSSKRKNSRWLTPLAEVHRATHPILTSEARRYLAGWLRMSNPGGEPLVPKGKARKTLCKNIEFMLCPS